MDPRPEEGHRPQKPESPGLRSGGLRKDGGPYREDLESDLRPGPACGYRRASGRDFHPGGGGRDAGASEYRHREEAFRGGRGGASDPAAHADPERPDHHD